MENFGHYIELIAKIIEAAGVLIIAIIVLIHTFLSFSLQVELEGKFPWQKDIRREKQKV